MSVEPVLLTLELVRTVEGDDPFAFRGGRQEYLVRVGTGNYSRTEINWDTALLNDLWSLGAGSASDAAADRVSRVLREFWDRTPLMAMESALQQAVEAGAPVILTLRAAAAELFSLPWSLTPLKVSGLLLAQLPGVLVRVCWPGSVCMPPALAPGRVLLAWSRAGGALAHEELIAAVQRLDADPAVFLSRDVLANASLDGLTVRLREAEASGEPYSAVQLLCHGLGGADGGAIVLNGKAGPARISGQQLAGALVPFARSLRLLVLMACSSGASGAPIGGLGGVALAAHRAGISGVIAARTPISMRGALVFSEALWRGLLARSESLEGAFCSARAALGKITGLAEQCAIQLYGREEEGADSRPIALRPYRGLLSFDIAHNGFFFGRDDEVRALEARVLDQMSRSCRLLVILGASGSGKSSLVRAGVLAALVARDPSWRVIALRLDRDTRAQVAAAWTSLETNTQPLWLIDPLDALFSGIEDVEQRAKVAHALLELSQQPAGMVIATLRPDLLTRCAEIVLPGGKRLDAALYATDSLAFVASLERDALRKAIGEPALRVGLQLEAGLTTRLLDDAGVEPGALPLLEYVLDLLWTQREGRLLTHAAYDGAGGLGGALAQAADALMQRMGSGAEVAWSILLGTVAVDSDGIPRRRATRLSELRVGVSSDRASFEHALAELVRARLLVLSGEGSKTTVELAHEALLRRWASFEARVLQDQERRRQGDEVRGLAELWSLHDRDPEYLLSGRRLGFAQEIVARVWQSPPELVAALLSASEEAAARAGAAALAALRERERLAAEVQTQARRARDGALLALASTFRERDPTRALLLLREVSSDEQDAGWVAEALAVLSGPVCIESYPAPTMNADLLSTVHPEDPTRWLVVGPAGAEVRFVGEETPRATMTVGGGGVSAAVWSSSGEHVVVLPREGNASVWTAEGVLVRELNGVHPPVVLARFSPDGARVLLSAQSGGLGFAPVDGAPFVRLSHQLGGVRLARWSAGGAWLATVATGEPRTVRIRPGGGGDEMVLRVASSEVRDIAFSPVAPRLLAVTRDGTAIVWSIPEGTSESVQIQACLRAAAWSSGGDEVHLGDEDGLVHALSLGDRRVRAVLRVQSSAVLGLRGRTGGLLDVLFADGQVRTVRTERASVPRRLVSGTSAQARVAWSRDGAWLAVGAMDGSVRLFGAHSARTHNLSPFEQEVTALAFSPDGARLVAASDSGQMCLWDVSSGRRLAILTGHAGQVDCIEYSPSGEMIASGGQEGDVLVWDAATARLRWQLTRHRNSVTSLSFDQGGLWSTSLDGTARLWRDGACALTIGEEVRRQVGATQNAVRTGALRPGGGLCLGFAGGGVSCVDAAEQRSGIWSGLGSSVCSLACSPDDRWIAAGGKDGTLCVWRAERESPILRLPIDGSAIESLAFDDASHRLILRTQLGAVVVVADDGVSRPLRLPLASPAQACALSPDGAWVLVGTQGGSVELWPVGSETVRDLLRQASRCVLSDEERQSLLGERRGWGAR